MTQEIFYITLFLLLVAIFLLFLFPVAKSNAKTIYNLKIYHLMLENDENKKPHGQE